MSLTVAPPDDQSWCEAEFLPNAENNRHFLLCCFFSDNLHNEWDRMSE